MHLLLATIELRPYVFIFLASFLAIAIINFGVRTTLLFTVLTYTVSLACEWSSVHNGFPFGLYHYLDATRGREIWIAGVPFMDSLSFTFLGFASYTVALLAASPLYRRGLDFRLLDTFRIRRAPRVWMMAALFMVMVDVVVDPLSVRGDRWFLGKIFWYDPPGPHFGDFHKMVHSNSPEEGKAGCKIVNIQPQHQYFYLLSNWFLFYISLKDTHYLEI